MSFFIIKLLYKRKDFFFFFCKALILQATLISHTLYYIISDYGVSLRDKILVKSISVPGSNATNAHYA